MPTLTYCWAVCSIALWVWQQKISWMDCRPSLSMTPTWGSNSLSPYVHGLKVVLIAMRTTSAIVTNPSSRWVFRYQWSTLQLGRVQQIIHCICFQFIMFAFLSLYYILFTYCFTLYSSPSTFYWTNSAFIRLCIYFFYSIHFQSGHYSRHFLHLFLQYFITCTGLQTSCKEGLPGDCSCWWGVSYHPDSSGQSAFWTSTFTLTPSRLYSRHPLYSVLRYKDPNSTGARGIMRVWWETHQTIEWWLIIKSSKSASE